MEEVKVSANEMEAKGYDPNNIFLPASGVNKKFDKIVVTTSRDQLELLKTELQKRSKDQLVKYFKETYNEIVMKSQEELIETKPEDSIWLNWKDAVLIFYICRFLLLNKEIQMILPSEKKE
jgi:hypothetical protein